MLSLKGVTPVVFVKVARVTQLLEAAAISVLAWMANWTPGWLMTVKPNRPLVTPALLKVNAGAIVSVRRTLSKSQ